MRIIKNINSATACALCNKGVKTLRAALDSLTKGDRKKMADYLVVPNNCVLSLSLSYRPGLTFPIFFLHVRARDAPYKPFRQRTSRKFPLSFLYACLVSQLKQNKNRFYSQIKHINEKEKTIVFATSMLTRTN